MNNLIGNIIGQIASGVSSSLANSPIVPEINAHNRPQVATVVRQELAKELAPTLEHLTNNEPWYRSRVTIGAVLSAAAAVAAIFGVSFDVPMMTEVVMAVGVLIGSAITLWGRWVATKPIGT
jgi:hypothetical protein